MSSFVTLFLKLNKKNMILPSPYIYYYTACFALIFSGIMCGVIRWFHVCSPYAEQRDYLYPARSQMTFFYIFQLLLAPYLFHPNAADTWLYVRVFGILYYPVCFTVILHCYFFNEGNDRGTDKKYVGVLPSVFILSLCGVAIAGKNILSTYQDLILGLSAALSLFVSVYMCSAILRLKRQIDRYNESNYSNIDNFPYKFASQQFLVPLLWMAMMWLVFLTDSREVKMWVDIFCILWQVTFLIIILHPQRKEKEDIEIKMDNNDAKLQNSETGIDEEKLEMLKQSLLPDIEKAFDKDMIYLNPNLTIKDLATTIGSNRRYTSIVMSSVYGSFLTYVNSLRIEHSLRLKEENPDWKQAELLTKSGFNTRASYNKWLSYYKDTHKRNRKHLL